MVDLNIFSAENISMALAAHQTFGMSLMKCSFEGSSHTMGGRLYGYREETHNHEVVCSNPGAGY